MVGGWVVEKSAFWIDYNNEHNNEKTGTNLGKEKYKNREQEIIQFHQKANLYLLLILYFETYEHQIKINFIH